MRVAKHKRFEQEVAEIAEEIKTTFFWAPL